MNKVGDRFEVTKDKWESGFSKGSIIEIYKDAHKDAPLFKLVSGSCDYTNADGMLGAWADFDGLRELSSAAITLRPGDYVSLREVKTDEEYDAVRDAFLAAGCKVTRHNCGMDAEGRVDWDFLGWDVSANILNRWDCGCETAGARLLTIAQVLGTATVEWDGTGLPPVGSVIKINTTSHRYRDHNGECVTVIAILKDPEDDMDFIVAMNDTAGYVAMRPSAFEPFNAERQRLTEELQQSANLKPKAAARVIAAGYRKEVVK